MGIYLPGLKPRRFGPRNKIKLILNDHIKGSKPRAKKGYSRPDHLAFKDVSFTDMDGRLVHYKAAEPVNLHECQGGNTRTGRSYRKALRRRLRRITQRETSRIIAEELYAMTQPEPLTAEEMTILDDLHEEMFGGFDWIEATPPAALPAPAAVAMHFEANMSDLATVNPVTQHLESYHSQGLADVIYGEEPDEPQIIANLDMADFQQELSEKYDGDPDAVDCVVDRVLPLVHPGMHIARVTRTGNLRRIKPTHGDLSRWEREGESEAA